MINAGIGRHGQVYLLGAEANKFVFANADAFSWRETFENLALVDGPTALIVSDGDDHRRRRSVVAPGLRHRQIQRLRADHGVRCRRHDRRLAARPTAGHLPGVPLGGAPQHGRESVRLSAWPCTRSFSASNCSRCCELTHRPPQVMRLQQRFNSPGWRRAMVARKRIDDLDRRRDRRCPRCARDPTTTC